MSEVVLGFHDILLHMSDVQLLNGPYWLNDTIISFYFEYLERIVFRHTQDILFVAPEVTQCIKLVPPEETPTFLEPLGMKKKKFVFFALNNNDSPDVAGGSHWSLFVYSKPDNHLFHIDSSRMCNDNVAWKFAINIMPYLRQEKCMEFVDKECVQQTNGYDCGIHLICNAESLAKYAIEHGELVTCDLLQINISPSVKRKEIAAIIANLADSSE